LPDPDTPVTQVSVPSGTSTSIDFEVVLLGAADLEYAARRAPLLRHRDRRGAGEELPVSDS
jgi:hypothetical protein